MVTIDPITATITPLLTRRRLGQRMKTTIAETAGTMRRPYTRRTPDATRGSGFSEFCALYLAVCDFVHTTHKHFFWSAVRRDEYYALRTVIKDYLHLLDGSHAARTWARDHGIINSRRWNEGEPPFYRCDVFDEHRKDCRCRAPLLHCGCNNPFRLASDVDELNAFYVWGPGYFIRDMPVGDARELGAAGHLWGHGTDGLATVWHTFAMPDHLTFVEFCNVFEAETVAEHVAWKHNMSDTVASLRNYDRMFATPHLSDYVQVMLHVRQRTNKDCMRLVDAFCGAF